MKTVDVFRRIDRFDDGCVVDLARQRKLRENPVDIVALIQYSDRVEQFGGADRLGQRVMLRSNSNLFASFDLVAHVNSRRRIVANAHGRETRPVTARFDYARDSVLYFLFDLRGAD